MRAPAVLGAVAVLLAAVLTVAVPTANVRVAGAADAGGPSAGVQEAATIDGSVASTDGAPVEGVVIDLFAANGDGSRAAYLGSTTSDAGGGYAFAIDSPTCHVIVAIAPAGTDFVGGSPWDEQPACFAEGETTVTVSSVLLPPTGDAGSIGDAVTEADDTGVGGVVIDLFTANGDGTRSSYLRSTSSDATGAYRFDVAQGCYVVVFIAPAGRTFTIGSPWSEHAVCVDPGEDVTTVDAELTPGEPPLPPPPIGGYGSDGSGSPDLGDCTVDTASADLSAAVDQAPAGAVVCIAAGDYGGQRLSITADDRTVKANGEVEIGAIEIGADRVTVDGLRITERSTLTGLDAAVEVRGDGNAIVNLFISDAPAVDGIACSARTDCSNTRIANNTITGIESIGITIHDSDNVVERNNVYGLVRTTTGYDVDAMRFFGQRHRIAENYFHDINEFQSARDADGDTPHVDCWQTFTMYESYNPPTNPIATADVTIENNYCVRVGRQCLIMENNRTDLTIVRDIVFRNNVCETYDNQIINLKGVEDVTIENNYLGGDPTYQTVVLQLSGEDGTKRNRNVQLRNNIVQRIDASVELTKGGGTVDDLVVEANETITRPTQITRSADFRDIVDVSYPPVTVSDFDEFAEQLPPTDVIDRGVTATAPAPVDLAGLPRVVGGAIDLGPYELG